MIENGGDKDALTDEGETPCDLVDTHDYETMAVLLNTKIDNVRRKISLSLPTLATPKIEPAWVRRESIQEEKEKMTPNLQIYLQKRPPMMGIFLPMLRIFLLQKSAPLLLSVGLKPRQALVAPS